MKIVLFLGAGFSRAWGLPVIQEFFQYAKDSHYLVKDDKDFLRELQAKAAGGANMLDVKRNNLEEILSFCLATENFNAGYAIQSDGEYSRLCRILHNVYRRIDLERHAKGGLTDNTRQLLGIREKEIPVGDNLSFITTNYDVMIEYCVASLRMYCIFPCKWAAIESTETEKHTGILCAGDHHGPLLCKLHGSVNWFSRAEGEVLQVENSLLRHEYTDDYHRHQFISFPKVSFGTYETIGTPLIIPPTLFKMQTAPFFRDIWRAAGKALREAEKLVFIGFSFPESDTHIRYFLGANLQGNVDLTTIEVVDPKADEICQRLQASKFGTHFKDLLRPVKGKWEETDYCVVD